MEDLQEAIEPDFITKSELRKQANGYQDLGAFGDHMDSIGLPMKRKAGESTWDDPTYHKLLKSNSKSPGEAAEEEEEEVYDPTADGEADDGGDDGNDKPEANIINHWQIGGGKGMPEPNTVEKSREFGDEVITGGKEKLKPYK